MSSAPKFFSPRFFGELTAPAQVSGFRLDKALRTVLGGSWGEVREQITTGKVRVNGSTCTDVGFLVHEGMTLALDPRARRPRPNALGKEAFLYVDPHVVVVNKPAGVSTVPYDTPAGGRPPKGKGEITLDALVREGLKRGPGGAPARPSLGIVHRLDRDTSGVMVFSRTWLAKKSLASQFRAHTVVRRYVAIAHGQVETCTIQSRLVLDRGDGLRGSLRPGSLPREGQLAVTHVQVLERLGGGTATLLQCRLETGRTHQIRIHLSEAGHPLLGERVYVRGFGGHVLPAPRLMLHAIELGFVHPATLAELRWEVAPPEDFDKTLSRLRGGIP